jgi:hypothetical protein
MPSGVLNILGETVMPQLLAALNGAGLADTLDILRKTQTSDGKGGFRETWAAINTDPLPCIIDATTTGAKNIDNERLTSRTKYKISFPRIQDDAVLALRADDRINVLERGLEGEKLFKIINIIDAGIEWQVNCELL